MLAELLIRARRNRWLRRLGRSAFRLPGVGGALHNLQQRILPQGGRVWVQITQGAAKGLWLKIDPYREEGYLRSSPEPEFQERLLTMLRLGICFYDVGAHIGFYSLLASRLVGREGCVVAFEPDSENAALLRENAARSNIAQIEIVCAAVGSRDGVAPFQRGVGHPSGRSSRRGAVLPPGSPGEVPGVIEVQSVTLDFFTQLHRPPHVIKVDVEGTEIEVLKGAQRVLTEVRPVWLCEVHHAPAASFIAEKLSQTGYKVEWLPAHPQFPFPRHIVAQPLGPSGAASLRA